MNFESINHIQLFVSIISQNLFSLHTNMFRMCLLSPKINAELFKLRDISLQKVITPLYKFIDLSKVARIIIIVNHANNDTVICIFDQWIDIVSTFVVRSVECIQERCQNCALRCASVRVDGRRPDAFETDIPTYIS